MSAEAFVDAATQGDEATVRRVLLSRSVDPNVLDPKSGGTALMGAAFLGHASVVTLLLGDDRVDPNIAGRKGFTALMWAAGKGHDSVVKVLLADGRVDPDLTSQHGRTAITYASLNRHDSVVKLLLADDAV